ncbi:hypothetical protein GCM10023215_49500 [Pseudonocardia yuanmonensis]|uniref:DNA-directed DNA polymerase n=1 Tax=Pseudonocardia yuanmonensis TaxID=1095914 RepID=A0ABP8XBC6_9PSEU
MVGSLARVALALYRKYRPAKFAEVVGQEHVTEPLGTALAAGRINHAYLFSGPRGCGKTSSARILARSLNCVEGPTPDPCGRCASCIALAPEGPGNIDVVELDAASHGGVDDARELRDRAFYAPAESRYRVFIVDEAHMVTTQGFNALLKIVEEPPEHLVFVFATTEPDKVLPTIRSRTHHYPFRLIPPGTLRALLERICADEGVRVEPAVYPLVIRAGGGSARDTLSVLDQLLAGAGSEGVTYERAVALLGVTDVALIDDVVDALGAHDGAAVYQAVDRLVEAGHDPRRFASDLLQRLRDLMLLQAVPEAAEQGLVEAADDELSRMIEQAARLGPATLTRYGEIVHAGLTEMRGATAPRLLLELLCARMLLPAATTSDAGLLERLERVERRQAIAPEPGGGVSGGVGSGGVASSGGVSGGGGPGGAVAPDGAEAVAGGAPRFVRRSQRTMDGAAPAGATARAERGSGARQGAASQSAASQNSAPQGSAPESAESQGAAPQGAALQGAAPQGGAAAQGAAPQTAAPQPVAPQGAAPQGAASQGAAPQSAAPQGAAPQSAAPQGAAPQTAASQGAAPQTAASQGAAPQTAAQESAARPGSAPQSAAQESAPSEVDEGRRQPEGAAGSDAPAPAEVDDRAPSTGVPAAPGDSTPPVKASSAAGTAARDAALLAEAPGRGEAPARGDAPGRGDAGAPVEAPAGGGSDDAASGPVRVPGREQRPDRESAGSAAPAGVAPGDVTPGRAGAGGDAPAGGRRDDRQRREAPARADAPSQPPATSRPAAAAEPVAPPAATAGHGLDASAVRRVWSEILAAARQRSRSTEALLVNATVRAVQEDTLVLNIASPPLARRLSDQRNTDVIVAALHAVLGVQWRVRCETGDGGGPAQPPPRQASQRSAPQRPSRREAPEPAEDRPSRPEPARQERPEPRRPAPSRSERPRGGTEDGIPLPPEPPADEPPPDDEEAMFAEADASRAERSVRRDPEEVAIELLSSELGARAFDQR